MTKKDTEVSLPFYNEQCIADVIIVDPATFHACHYDAGAADRLDTPSEVQLRRGCRLTV